MSYKHLWDEIYEKRLARLASSDWTQVVDSPLTAEQKAAWAVYRQALRDIPQKWPSDVDKETVNPLDTLDIFPKHPS